ncbi:hypothetical protein [Leifsonia sp. 1010]|nr:hypothetical protein [Leifsonia sp. 1010]MDR6610950.1 hypothetical protein [Leifsonia sp. 1010]
MSTSNRPATASRIAAAFAPAAAAGFALLLIVAAIVGVLGGMRGVG